MTLYVTTFLSIFGHTNVRTPQLAGLLRRAPGNATRATTSAACTPATTPTCRCSTCCSGPSTTRANIAPEQGFYDGASRRVLDMLRFRDVAEPAVAAAAAVDARASSINQSRNAMAAGDSVRTLRRGHAR